MNRETRPSDVPVIPPVPLSPDESLNSNYTAIPRDTVEAAGDPTADDDLVSTQFEYGNMNEADARESGYIEDRGAPDTRRYSARTPAQPQPSTFWMCVAGVVIGAMTIFALRGSSRSEV